MAAMRAHALRLVVLPILLASVAACRGGIATDPGGGSANAGPGAPASSASPGADASSGAVVNLTGADLAPVDAYVHARSSQWIVGDDVEVFASREYFATALTMNAPTSGLVSGVVRRVDEMTPEGPVVTMTYLGAKSTSSIQTNPRVLIGTGITVSARRTLRVRLVKTSDANVPVRLRVQANGEAVRGRREEVLERAPSIVIGGTLRRQGGGHVWETIERR